MAAEWGGRGLRVNAVCPGWIKTEMDVADQGGGAYSDADIVNRVPMARFASPEDVAQAIAFLLDAERSAFINGVSFPSTAAGSPMADGRACGYAPGADAVWLRETSPTERHTLLAACLGYGLDGFDYMIYSFIMPTLLAVWHMSKAQAGYIATGALMTSAVGGWAAGVLADRYGRVRVLQWTVGWFAVFTALSGFTDSYPALFVTRALQGFGFGGEWAVGSILIAETIAARHRGKAVGLVQSSWAIGWAAAALRFGGLYALLPAELAWRVLFWIGIAPALLIVYVRRRVQESPLYASLRDRRGEAHFLDIFAAAAAPYDGTRELVVHRDAGSLLRGELVAADLSVE